MMLGGGVLSLFALGFVGSIVAGVGACMLDWVCTWVVAWSNMAPSWFNASICFNPNL